MILLHCVIGVVTLLAATSGEMTTPEIPYTVLLFPGLAGSQIQARLDRTKTTHWYCQKKSDWYRIWMDAKSLILPLAQNCFVDNFRLVYNNETGRTENVPGVETRVEDFGNVTTLEYFFVKAEPAGYFHRLIVSLESNGYVRGVSLRGAPYEFRKAPYESDFTDLKRLIENMYTENGNKKTVLVCHSNGCNNNYYFLLQATDAWKKKYIQAWVTLGAPLGGATMGLAAVVTGDNFNIALISKTVAYDLEHTFSSIGAVLPVSSVFENITLLSLEGKDYTAKDIPQIYRLVNDTVGATMWQKSVDVLDATFPHPGVEVHCLRAIGTPTVQSLQFWSRKSFPRSPRNVFGPGDGTVNQVSSDVCLRWRDQPDFHTVEFGRPVNHMLLGTGQQTADYLIQEVLHL